MSMELAPPQRSAWSTRTDHGKASGNSIAVAGKPVPSVGDLLPTTTGTCVLKLSALRGVHGLPVAGSLRPVDERLEEGLRAFAVLLEQAQHAVVASLFECD